ncbi:MAG: hypothetical protein HC869_17680 [Rhodospirillales bacterium]|nr:hypothetical protein [Rhodospirillales bacterium]
MEEELRARAGRASGARTAGEISSDAADVADEYARDTVKYGALYYLLRWLGIVKSADKAVDQGADAARAGTQALPKLQRIHSVETLTKGSARYDYEAIRKNVD